MPPNDPPDAPVQHVQIKAPEFNQRNPRVWFRQIEAQFEFRQVTAQKTKYNFIVATLPPEVAEEVFDLIDTVPAETPYDKIKAAVINLFSKSEQKQLRDLLAKEPLGDRKPTQYLR